jgi:bifunctional DNA-binding transcriptional regulator/antitoxin component of YhaV-PrlF toxin-antitoxin module
MKIELGTYIVKKLKTLEEFNDLGKDDLKESVTELIEELLEEYANDNASDNNDTSEDDE